MARLARSEVFKADEVGVYHAFNRTCRRSWLHGVDPLTGVDHSHRRDWFQERMQFLSQYLCLEILAFAIMSNHWHCVIRNRPDLVQKLTDRQVAIRWLSLLSRRGGRKKQGDEIAESEIEAILSQPEFVAELRQRLSSISCFVGLMCQTVARRCNIEDECTGRFFEERFKLNKLEDEADVLACMAYVDLNPIRSGMVDSLDAADANVSIAERLRGLDGEPVDTSSWLAPLELASEVDGQPAVVFNNLSAEEIERRRQDLTEQMGCVPMSLEAYQRLLWHLAFESCPELQVNAMLTADQLREPTWRDGTPVDLESLLARTQPLERRCNASISSHACRAIRERAARSSGATPHGPPVPT